MAKDIWKERTEAALSTKGTFPPSFHTNNAEEKFVIWRAENFRAQCASLLPEIEPLVLTLENEVGTKKFVCTTITPNFLPFWDLYSWQGCASFVADHIRYVPSERPRDLPKTLYSPACVLQTTFATSFEVSTLLCSLLMGVGYDAYVIYGWANKRRVAERDLTWRKYPPPYMMNSPLSSSVSDGPDEQKRGTKVNASTAVDRDVLDTVTGDGVASKYVTKLRPKKEFTSEYEAVMAKRELARSSSVDDAPDVKLASDGSKGKQGDGNGSRESSFKEDDKAIHSWVLILPGKRGVHSAFFIEPSTGEGLPMDAADYYEVVSLWNNENYWVNMNPTERNFDLNNPEAWEPFSVDPLLRTRLFKAVMQQQQRSAGTSGKTATSAVPTVGATGSTGGSPTAPSALGGPGGVAAAAAALVQHQKEISASEMAIQQAMDAEEVPDWLPAFKIPSSWVGKLRLSTEKFEKRYPDGKKVECFENAEVERFAPYLMQNGLMKREKFFSQAKDDELDVANSPQRSQKNKTNLAKIVESFSNRSDFLQERVEEFEEPKAGWITEKFLRGRQDGVKDHHFLASSRVGGIVQKLVYWPGVRPDGLLSRESTAGVRLVEKYDSLLLTEHLGKKEKPADIRMDEFSHMATKNPYETRNAWCLASIYRRQPKEKAVIFDKQFKGKVSPGSCVYPRIKEITEIYTTNNGHLTTTYQEVASLTFTVDKREIKVTYAPRSGRITFSTITFHVPPLNEKGQVEVFTMDMVQIHQADANDKIPSRLELYRILEQLVNHQAKSEEQVVEALKENDAFIACREAELSSLTLLVSVFHPDRNSGLRAERLEEEKQEAERRARASEDTVDPLLPYLCRHKPAEIPWEDFYQNSSRPDVDLKDSSEICDEYLTEIRSRIVDKANHMQAKLEQTEIQLRQMQQEYQSKVGQLSAQRERQLTETITTLSFSLKVLEKRLKFLRRDALEKYQREEKTLKSDSRIHFLMIP